MKLTTADTLANAPTLKTSAIFLLIYSPIAVPISISLFKNIAS